MADIPTDETIEVIIRDSATSDNELKINTDGSINVAGLVTNIPSSSTISQYVKDGKVFTISGTFTATNSSADSPLVLIHNPTNSTKVLYLYRLFMGLASLNVGASFSIYYNPTITTAGTSVTPRNNLVGSSLVTSMVATSLPTVSALGTQLVRLGYGQNNNSLDYMGDFSIHVQPNNSLLITAQPSSNNRDCTITVTWAEV
jgi:hypothetical protein